MLFKTICVNWHTPFTHDLISGDFSGLIPNSPTIRTLKNYSIVCSMFFGVVFILYCLCLRLLIFPYSCGLELFGSKYSHYPFIYLYPFWNHWCKCNNNGLLLLETCNAHDFLISNTVFRLFTRNKTSWMHPPSKHWHLLDYVTVWQRDRQNVWVTKTMCGADCWTNHCLLILKLRWILYYTTSCKQVRMTWQHSVTFC